ncbi:MAG TPA: Calx-beta domain-containing protein [Pyrinomonadaceae bacterium]|jgi:hypothetical protein
MPRTTPRGPAAAPRRLLTLALFAALGLAAASISARTAAAQTLNAGSPDLVISQVYARGGEPGAAFRNDYVEVFNRGNTTINLADYSVQVLVIAPPQPGGFPGGPVIVVTRFVSSSGSYLLPPGEHELLAYGSSGSNGAPVPGVFAPSNDFNMPGNFGRVALVRGVTSLGQFGCPAGTDAALVDFFSYGAATCAEGPAVFPAPAASSAAFRNSNGCADTDSNVTDFTTAAANPRDEQATPAAPCNLTAPANTFRFEVAGASFNESAGVAEVFVTRAGDASGAASVQYATSDDLNSAADRRDYTTAFGTLNFAAGETRKSLRVLITDDVRPDNGELFYLGLANPTGAALGSPHIMRLTINDADAGGAPNPIDSTDFFVRQHYADFLGRAPDESGRTFWTNEIDSCGADAQCREVKRINVSAAFFLSIEFQVTGDFAYRAYKASFADHAVFRPRGFPTYRELWRDARRLADGVVVGQDDYEQRLNANRQAYMAEFVTRPEFLIRYPATQTPAEFVDALNANAGNPLSQDERDRQIADLTAAGNTAAGRAAVLAALIEDADFRQAERNRSFVLMEYFGYLRRNPNGGPDTDFTGYDFWLSKLNQFNGDYIESEMVKAFLSSDEYRQHFGQ